MKMPTTEAMLAVFKENDWNYLSPETFFEIVSVVLDEWGDNRYYHEHKKTILKVGQTWRRHDGEVVEIVQKGEDHSDYPFICSKGNSYTGTGTFYSCSYRDEPDPWDLIELITDAPNSEPHP